MTRQRSTPGFKILGPAERYNVPTSGGTVEIRCEKDTDDGLVLEDAEGCLWWAEKLDRWRRHIAVGERLLSDGPDPNWHKAVR